jgi:predicted nuclease with TOPRIM domain
MQDKNTLQSSLEFAERNFQMLRDAVEYQDIQGRLAEKRSEEQALINRKVELKNEISALEARIESLNATIAQRTKQMVEIRRGHAELLRSIGVNPA